MAMKYNYRNISQGCRTAGLCLVALALGCLLATQPASAAVVSFQGIGDLPGGSSLSRATAISADGSVVVGYSSSASGTEAFRWTAGSGIVGLGDLSGGSFQSEATAISADGSTIVGWGNSPSGYEAFRWTASGGVVGLGDLSGGNFKSGAYGASADGAVIVGKGNSASGTEAFRWTAGGGMVGLGDLPGGNFLSQSLATSLDGSIVVGQASAASGTEAFRWTAGGGMVGLGSLSTRSGQRGHIGSAALSMSSDSSIIVGWDSTGGSYEAFRWTAGGGMVGLGDLPGGAAFSNASAISADGSVIVGNSAGSSGYEAFLWTAADGMRPLRDILVTDFGLDLTGWQLQNATKISADGMTFTGYGIGPDGYTEAWIATIPEPATLSLFVFGGMVLLRRKR